MRTYVAEPERGRRKCAGKEGQKEAVYGNRRRIRGNRGKALLRKRGELLERSFAHLYETGAMRRLYVRGKENVQKKLLLQAAAGNLALILRHRIGAGTPRGLQDLLAGSLLLLLWLIWAETVIGRPLKSQGKPEIRMDSRFVTARDPRTCRRKRLV